LFLSPDSLIEFCFLVSRKVEEFPSSIQRGFVLKMMYNWHSSFLNETGSPFGLLFLKKKATPFSQELEHL
jgi:hypothetical protein